MLMNYFLRNLEKSSQTNASICPNHIKLFLLFLKFKAIAACIKINTFEIGEFEIYKEFDAHSDSI